MIVYKDLDLTKYSTMRIHSTCEVMYTPENVPELRDIVAELKGNY